MKPQSKSAIALFGGVTTLVLAVGFGGSELASSTTTQIATPTSSVTPAPPATADPGNGDPGAPEGPVFTNHPTPHKNPTP